MQLEIRDERLELKILAKCNWQLLDQKTYIQYPVSSIQYLSLYSQIPIPNY